MYMIQSSELVKMFYFMVKGTAEYVIELGALHREPWITWVGRTHQLCFKMRRCMVIIHARFKQLQCSTLPRIHIL